MKKLPKNTHLIISSVIVIGVSFIYGFNPSKILPQFFNFKVEVLELKNIFRAIMGLYLAFAAYWILGTTKPKYWQNATITNVLFMGGLSFGRIMSTIFDGISPQYSVGLLGELVLMFWGIYNLKNIKEFTK